MPPGIARPRRAQHRRDRLRGTLERPDLPKIDPTRLVQSLENAAVKLPSVLDDTRHEIDAVAAETAAARQRLGVTFPTSTK
jgi:hypothetical protein